MSQQWINQTWLDDAHEATGQAIHVDDWLPAVINDTTIHRSTKTMCYLIANYIDDNGDCRLTVGALARASNARPAQIHHSLTWLKRQGWLLPTGLTSYTTSLRGGAA